MRGNLVKLFVVVTVVGLLSAPALATGPKGPALNVAPTDLNCTIDTGTITCTWTAIDNTTVKKYAIAILAGYDSVEDATCAADFWLDWDFTVPAGTTEFSFTPADLEYCPDGCVTPVSIDMIKVKGLTVPKKDGGSNEGSQNNPFAIYDTPFGFCPAG